MRCVDGENTGLIPGAVYTVFHIQGDGFVEFQYDDNGGIGYTPRRFQLVEEPTCNMTNPFAPGSPHAIMRLPTTAAARKAVPICTGVLDYFPDAIADVARLSKIGNEQHNPGEPLHWARGKSTDQADCILRHQMDRGTVDVDGVLHDAKVAWRALAQLQLAIEKLRDEGVAYPPAQP